MKAETIKRLLDVVKGKIPPDTIIVNGKIVNVFTNSIDEGIVVLKDGYIASVEAKSAASTYKASHVIDADGLYLCPGFVDAHTHLDSLYLFHEFVPYSIRGGTTTVVTETSAVACAAGMQAVTSFINSAKNYPVRCFFLAPPLTPPFPKMEGSMGLSLSEFRAMLKRDDVVGIGEAYWTRIVEGDRRILEQAAAAISLNKKLDGHSAGASGKKLIQYILTGITSCHESTTIEEVLERLKAGLYVMIREGFVRKELPELSKLKNFDIDFKRIILVSDVFDAVMLCEEGYLDSIVRKAVAYGFLPIEAIKMVTINPADYYGLRHVGAIAPLRCANIVFTDSLEKMPVKKVMAHGEIVFDNGKFIKKIKPYQYPLKLLKTIKAKWSIEEDFRIKARKNKNLIRVIDIWNQTITKEIHVNAVVKDGFLEKNIEEDIIPIAVINRYNSNQKGNGFIRGTGIKNGAIATTLIWDTGNILTIGSSEKDMAAAVNRLIELNGGTVISQSGKVIYEFAMPVFGIMPAASIEEIKEKTIELEIKLKDIGTFLERPFLTIQTIPFTGLPFLRISDKGLVDIKNKKLVSVFVK